MKPTKNATVRAALVLSSLAGYASAAAIIGNAYEGFNYAVGFLGTPTGGTGFNGTGSGTAGNTAYRSQTGTQITSGTLDYTGAAGYAAETGNKLSISGAAATGQVFRDIGQTVDSGTVYFSYLTQRTTDTNRSLNVAFFPAPNTTNNEKVGFGQIGAANGLGNNTGGNFGLVLNNSTLITSTTPVAMGNNTTHLVIGRIDFDFFTGGLERITFYMDPTDVSSEPLTPYIQTTVGNSIDIIALAAFRPFAGNSSTGSLVPSVSGDFDEFRFGSTFASVVPEPSSALLLVGGCAGLLLRRMRT